LEITTGIQSKDVVSAEIAFNVDRSWLLENGILKDDVVLLRFNEGKWVEMPTRYLMLQNNSHYYAASVGGFSVFAISKKAVIEKEPVIEIPKTEEITASAVAVPEEKPVEKQPWYAMKAPWVSLLAVLFAACIVEAIYLSHFIHMRHRKK
ncbi:MAG: PGF-pre-PGF domain-containing protein, partial [Candidatus Nanoarchaeia archaeon]